jgi:hypothetical protein
VHLPSPAWFAHADASAAAAAIMRTQGSGIGAMPETYNILT